MQWNKTEFGSNSTRIAKAANHAAGNKEQQMKAFAAWKEAHPQDEILAKHLKGKAAEKLLETTKGLASVTGDPAAVKALSAKGITEVTAMIAARNAAKAKITKAGEAVDEGLKEAFKGYKKLYEQIKQVKAAFETLNSMLSVSEQDMDNSVAITLLSTTKAEKEQEAAKLFTDLKAELGGRGENSLKKMVEKTGVDLTEYDLDKAVSYDDLIDIKYGVQKAIAVEQKKFTKVTQLDDEQKQKKAEYKVLFTDIINDLQQKIENLKAPAAPAEDEAVAFNPGQFATVNEALKKAGIKIGDLFHGENCKDLDHEAKNKVKKKLEYSEFKKSSKTKDVIKLVVEHAMNVLKSFASLPEPKDTVEDWSGSLKKKVSANSEESHKKVAAKEEGGDHSEEAQAKASTKEDVAKYFVDNLRAVATINDIGEGLHNLVGVTDGTKGDVAFVEVE